MVSTKDGGDWRQNAKTMDGRFKRRPAKNVVSDTEESEANPGGGIYPASSEPEWALKQSKLTGPFKKTKPPVHIKNAHKAPINRVIETTEGEMSDGNVIPKPNNNTTGSKPADSAYN